MEKRYGVLRFIATLWKILAWIVLVLGILGAIASLIGGIAGGLDARTMRDLGIPGFVSGTLIGVMVFVVALVGAVLQFLVLYAAGEVVSVFLAIEENTRATRALLERRSPSQATYPPPQPATPASDELPVP
ncbi:MAG: hypothetical protein JXB35_03490 [Anaerolineae bacterium]|nr:hypothetical protein [Anaerolineae bacterium]